MRVRLEIQLTPPAIGYVGVELRGCEIGMSEHFLNGPQVGASLEQVRRKRVAQQMRVDALGLEPGLAGQATQDEEDAGAGERAAVRIEEELRPVVPVEVRATAREVTAKSIGGLPSDRDDPLLVSLAEAANEPV